LANHPERTELGTRVVPTGPDFYLARRDLEGKAATEVRLKDLVNIELPASPPAPGRPWMARFTSRENKRIPRLQWVGAGAAIPVDILGVEGEHTAGLGEAALAEAHPGEVLQFERVGFVRVERDWIPGSAPLRVVFGHP
jgi:hypothetical protein